MLVVGCSGRTFWHGQWLAEWEHGGYPFNHHHHRLCCGDAQRLPRDLGCQSMSLSRCCPHNLDHLMARRTEEGMNLQANEQWEQAKRKRGDGGQ